MERSIPVRGCSALSDVSSDISLSPLYIPPHLASPRRSALAAPTPESMIT